MKIYSVILLVLCTIIGGWAKPPPTFLEYKDSHGQYSFGYSAPDSARSEVRSLDGSTRGSYSYVDDAGVIQSAQYTADSEHGFRIVATNLPRAPKPIEETPEVVAARNEHFKALESASKLNEEMPEMEGRPSLTSATDEKAADSVAIENYAVSEGEADSPNKFKTEGKDVVTRVTAKLGVEGGENESEQILEKSEHISEKSEQISEKSYEVEPMSMESLPKATDSSRPYVPVVTTSFVIPGRVNLHSRVELDQSGAVAAPFSPKSSAEQLRTTQFSKPEGQDTNYDPSMITPSGTRMMSMEGNEKSAMLDDGTPFPAGPEEAIRSSHLPQKYSTSYLPGAIAPSNAYAYLTYGIGVDPIYRQYNPYRYYPYGIL